jgi:hypothetical protein
LEKDRETILVRYILIKGIRLMFYELLPPITWSVISSIGYASIASQVCAPALDPRRLSTRPDPRLNARCGEPTAAFHPAPTTILHFNLEFFLPRSS